LAQRETFKSQFGFLMAAVGSAIGLGNIWRFSYMAYSNGGGAFLIPYLTALITTGIPLLLLEFTIGHERFGSAPLAIAKMNRKWEWLGWSSVVLVMFALVLYYAVIVAWCADFVIYSFNFAWGNDPNTFFFKEFLGLTDKPFDMGSIRIPILLSLIFIWIVNWVIVARGVGRGIEIANMIFMPVLFILTTGLLVRAVFLDGAMEGIRAFIIPDFSKLTDPKVWLNAYSQIFFSLSISMGVMIAYSSYLSKKANLSKNAIITGCMNSGFSLFAGVAVFSVLGFMAHSQSKPISDVVSQSIGLAFVAYPKAISLMPGGKFFGAVFFFSLLIAGLSSSISLIESFTSAAMDKFGIRRGVTVTVLCILGLLGSLVFSTQAGLYWLDILDHFVSDFGLVFIGIFECILAGWIFKLTGFQEHINKISSIKVGPLWAALIKYFIPAILAIIFFGTLIKEIGSSYGGYNRWAVMMIGMNWLIVVALIVVFLATRKWRTDYLRQGNEKKNNQ
jgi:neurotransmitter:Na+ symporter, NSS family